MLAIGFAAVLSSVASQDAPAAATSTEPVPATRLVYVPAQKFAERCPTKLEVEAGIADRIGSSPFSEPAARIVVLTLDGDVNATKAKVELFDPELKSLGERNLESGGGCADLVEAAELAISIALAPSLALGQKPPPPIPAPPPPPIEPRPVELPAEAKAKEPEPPKEKPFQLLLGGGVDAAFLLSVDSPLVGPAVSLAIRAGNVEARIERHEHVFPGVSTKLGGIEGAGIATIAPCAHYPLFSVLDAGDAVEVSGCGTASVGEAWAVGAYIGPGPYVGAGGRIGAEWMQANMASFRVWGQVEYSVRPVTFIALNGASPGRADAPVTLDFGMTYEIPINF